VSQNDGYGHGLVIQAAAGTNNAAPGTVQRSGQTLLQSTTSYSAALAPTTTTGPNGDIATTTYDTYGRVATTVSALGLTTTYAYDYSQRTTTGTTTYGGWQRTTADGFGRTLKAESGDGTGTKSIVESQYAACACSPLGKLWRVSQPYAPGGTAVWTTYTYDGRGRTVAATAPDGSATTTLYSGNATTVYEGLTGASVWKRYVRDVSGNLTAVYEPNPDGGADLVTSYTYDLLNHR
jgi:YD repeat-containing protein